MRLLEDWGDLLDSIRLRDGLVARRVGLVRLVSLSLRM